MHDHLEGGDPRAKGRCVRCGKPTASDFPCSRRLPDIGPAKPFTPDLASDHFPLRDPTRNADLEAEFLTDAVQMAQRASGVNNPAYAGRVYHRLDIGRKRYGDGDYLTKNNMREVMEETPDLAAYAMLELQRVARLPDVERDTLAELRLDLVAVAAYGAIADWYAQRAGRRLALRGLTA